MAGAVEPEGSCAGVSEKHRLFQNERALVNQGKNTHLPQGHVSSQSDSVSVETYRSLSRHADVVSGSITDQNEF